MVNWYLSDNVRFSFTYGYGSLDRFGTVGDIAILPNPHAAAAVTQTGGRRTYPTAAVVLAALSLAPIVGVGVPAVRAAAGRRRLEQFTGSWSARGAAPRRSPRKAAAPPPSSIFSGAIVLASTGIELGGGGSSPSDRVRRWPEPRRGRAVWTDARGDRASSEIGGEPFASGPPDRGTITGGTGRYLDGLVGDYELATCSTWCRTTGRRRGRRTVDLRGRFRTVTPSTKPTPRRQTGRRSEPIIVPRSILVRRRRDVVHAAAARLDGSGVASLRHLRGGDRLPDDERPAHPDRLGHRGRGRGS